MSKKQRTRYILRLEGINSIEILNRYNIVQQKEYVDDNPVCNNPPKFLEFKDITTLSLLLSEDGKPYPKSTSSRCKWDTYPFENSPIGVPIKYWFDKGTHNFICDGYFCSLSCVKAYIRKNIKDNPLYGDTMTNFLLLCKLTGNENIIEAGDWELLDCYNDGVGITINELRKNQVIYRRTNNVKIVPCGMFYEVKL